MEGEASTSHEINDSAIACKCCQMSNVEKLLTNVNGTILKRNMQKNCQKI